MSGFINNGAGVLAIETYFPRAHVTQEDLEVAYGVSAGKYTIGLGQTSMAFTGDREDINSIALTVVHSLFEKYNIDPSEVGRMEIGTESLIDKSKSTKTVLMKLFEESGNCDVEGATVVNACYGGTAALLNALSWVDSSSWDGRYAIVIAADIAVYAAGPARPTGGMGAVAMLVGRNAPLQFDLRTRCTHASDKWDFYKPQMNSEYPTVNGGMSQNCYLKSLDDCYTRFIQKTKKVSDIHVDVASTDYFLLHSPYNKLVQKGFARLLYQDMLSGSIDGAAIAKWRDVNPDETYDDRELEGVLKAATGSLFKQKLALPCEISKVVGNTYTASVWLNLAYLVSNQGANLLGKNIVLYSYGSGALATMIRVVPTEVEEGDARFTFAAIQAALNLDVRLADRDRKTPEDLNVALKAREDSHHSVPFVPTFSTDDLAVGTYYLESISAAYERKYTRKV